MTLRDAATGRLWITKTPTTPHDPSEGFLAGVDKALALAGARPGALRHVLHGTTTATNAILEDKGAATGLLTTAGFRYVLEIGRHDIPRRANMWAWTKPARPVPPELIFEIAGRVGADGDEIESLDEAAVREAARRLRAADVASVAICSCTAMPPAPTSVARATSCARSIRSARSRCRATCCRCSGSSSARW